MTTELVPVKHDAIPSTYDEIKGMATAFVQSGMFQDTKQLAQAIVKIQAGRELGLPPVYSMQNINMIRNRLTTSANTMAMLVKKSGRYNYRIKENTDKNCTITFYEVEVNKWLEVGESSFSMDDVKRAELVKPESGWVKFPRAMLFSRAISQGARIFCPDAIGGIYTDEEIRSIPPKPDETETSGEIIEPTNPPDPPSDAVTMKNTPSNEPVKEKAQAEQRSAISEANQQVSEAKKGPPKRDPSTIKNSTDLVKYCLQDWPNEFKSSKDVAKELGIDSMSMLTIKPSDAYKQIAAVRQK